MIDQMTPWQLHEVWCRPNGPTLFRNAVLRKQGWAVLSVPWFEFSDVQYVRIEYLSQRLKKLLQNTQQE